MHRRLRGFGIVAFILSIVAWPTWAARNCESSVRQILKNIRYGQEQMLEGYPVRGAVAVLLVKDGKVLMGLRKGSRGDGSWGFPGGRMELGELPRQAAKREVEEETGLKLQKLEFLRIATDLDREAGIHYITFLFMAKFEGEPIVCEPAKCGGWTLYSPENPPAPLFNVNSELLRTLHLNQF